MKPGTYTVTLYQGELEAGTGSAKVLAGETSSLTLISNLDLPSVLWSIGKLVFLIWDFEECRYLNLFHCRHCRRNASGVISEMLLRLQKNDWSCHRFLNADRIETVHP